MSVLRHLSIAALAFAMTLPTPSYAAQVPADGTSPIQLEFGVYSSNKPSAMVRVFKPTLKQLETSMTQTLGRPVDIRMQIARDYDEGISDLTSGTVDFSRFGPSSYIEARRINPGLRILAMESEQRSKVFYGIIAVHTDSDIQTLEDLRGRSFAFGDEGSTIGRFLSQLHLEQNDIRAGDLEEFDYLGRHDKVGTAVGAGDYDAGALNEKTFTKLVAAGEPIRELARFSNVTKPWIASSTLQPEILDALRSALLDLDDERSLATLKIDGFFEGDDSDYERIRRSMEENDRFFAERKSEARDIEQLDAVVTIDRDSDTVRLGIEVPGSLFEDLASSTTSRVLIELQASPVLGAATPPAQDRAQASSATPIVQDVDTSNP